MALVKIKDLTQIKIILVKNSTGKMVYVKMAPVKIEHLN